MLHCFEATLPNLTDEEQSTKYYITKDKKQKKPDNDIEKLMQNIRYQFTKDLPENLQETPKSSGGFG